MIFVFCISRVLRRPFFREQEKMFWLLFSLLREQLFSMFFFLPVFCVSEYGNNDSVAERQGALAIAMNWKGKEEKRKKIDYMG